MKMINFKNSATLNGPESGGKSKMMGVGDKKGNQTDVTPRMLQLALLIPHPLTASTSKTASQLET